MMLGAFMGGLGQGVQQGQQIRDMIDAAQIRKLQQQQFKDAQAQAKALNEKSAADTANTDGYNVDQGQLQDALGFTQTGHQQFVEDPTYTEFGPEGAKLGQESLNYAKGWGDRDPSVPTGTPVPPVKPVVNAAPGTTGIPQVSPAATGLGGQSRPGTTFGQRYLPQTMSSDANPTSSANPDAPQSQPAPAAGLPQRPTVAQAFSKPAQVDAMDYYAQHGAPQVYAQYLAQGNIEGAQKFQEMMNTNQAKRYTQQWSKAYLQAQGGDHIGAVQSMVGLYNQMVPDGQYAAMGQDTQGNPTVDIRDSKTHKVVSTHNAPIQELAGMALGTMSPEKMAPAIMAMHAAELNHQQQIQLEQMKEANALKVADVNAGKPHETAAVVTPELISQLPEANRTYAQGLIGKPANILLRNGKPDAVVGEKPMLDPNAIMGFKANADQRSANADARGAAASARQEQLTGIKIRKEQERETTVKNLQSAQKVLVQDPVWGSTTKYRIPGSSTLMTEKELNAAIQKARGY